ncbi:signal transduction histidine kinase [Anaerolinea thermolimosa]|uniref:ATP-binding response regulator n=1 Tax=Anaerolinea thermolimosa TaxID=229919 RepID=UPI000782EC8A|nr:hybrid sensor histidine kinase/response regulator [Anaerolinea thermolimosa]GAP05180.1 signal transduction histidine kinase [Anaerolinea thermolimosa]
MFYYQILNSRADPVFLDSAVDLLQTTTRRLIYLICAAVYLWQVCSGLIWEGGFPIRFLPASLIIAITAILALRILDQHMLVARVVILIGFFVGLMLYTLTLRQVELVYTFAMLPLLAALMIGWPAGVIAEGIIALAMLALAHTTPSLGLNFWLMLVTIISGLISCVAGVLVVSSLLTVTQWAVFSYQDANQKMELARNRQMELLHIQDDLIQANNELARLSERLKVMTLVAEEARRVKEEFVANVSHELRTPLNMIIGFAETIIQAPGMYQTRLPAKLMADIAAIHRNSQQLVGLINDVLDLSQIEAGRMTLTKSWNFLDVLIHEAIQSVEAFFASRGLYLNVEPGPEKVEVYCDGTRIREVMLNLLSNAGRFTENGGVHVRWWVESEKVIVAVRDTGPGIAPEDRERLFQPFQQLDTRLNRREGGSGLGLSISRKFIEMHSGQMWVDSQPGQGSTFYFSLPLEISPQTRSAARGALRWVNEYVVHEKRERPFKAPLPIVCPRYVVLETGNSLQRIFHHHVTKVEIHGTNTVQEAVGELRRSPSQGLIVNRSSGQDINLQEVTLPFDTPLIYCSIPDASEVSQQMGIHSYLIKPVTRQQVLETVKKAIGHGKKILVINDNTEELQLFVRILESAGENYQVLRATSGTQGLLLMRQRHPSLVLLDLRMQYTNNYDLLNERKKDKHIRDIPIVVISSQDPLGSGMIAESIQIMRQGGISPLDLVRSILAVTEVLSPISPPPAPTLEEEPPDALVSG